MYELVFREWRAEMTLLAAHLPGRRPIRAEPCVMGWAAGRHNAHIGAGQSSAVQRAIDNARIAASGHIVRR